MKNMNDDLLKPILVDKPEFNAKWISPKNSARIENYYFRARKVINVKSKHDEALLHIAAESVYRLYVNGKEVGCGPARGTYSRNYADTYDIASLLCIGENYIAVEVFCNNVPNYKTSPAQPGLFVQCEELDLLTNETWQVLPAKDWRQDVKKYTFQSGFMEWRDYRCDPLGWLHSEDSEVWEEPAIVSENEKMGIKELLMRDIPGLQISRYLPTEIPIIAQLSNLTDCDNPEVAELMSNEPHLLLDLPDTVKLENLCKKSAKFVELPLSEKFGVALIFDFSREINGGFELDLEASEGTIVDIGYEEKICEGRLLLNKSHYDFADRFICRSGRQLISNKFNDRGFRYLQVNIRSLTGPVRIHSLNAIDRIYPCAPKASFSCSDSNLNTIWEKCINTMSACATDVFVDCPWRENAFWVNDLIIENIIWLQAFGDGRLNARCFRLALSQMLPDVDIIPGVCPYDGNPMSALLATNLFLPLALEEYSQYTLDEKMVQDVIGKLLQIFKQFEKWEDEDGLLVPPPEYSSFVDWSFPMNSVDLNGKKNAVLNWFYVLGMNSMIHLLAQVGDDERAEYYTKKSARTVEALDDVFWEKEEKRYCDWVDSQEGQVKSSHQLTHALAILSNKYDPAKLNNIQTALSQEDILRPDLYMAHFVIRALCELGKPQEALQKIRKYWTPIAKSSSPTVWEAGVYEIEKEAFDQAGSLCHGFATTPVEFFQRTILGINPLKKGFSKFSVNPQILELNYASGAVPTPYGIIQIEWVKQKGGKVNLVFTVPQNCVAVLADGQEFNEGQHFICCDYSSDECLLKR